MNNFQKFLVVLFSLLFVATTVQYDRYQKQRKEVHELERQIENLKDLRNDYESIQL